MVLRLVSFLFGRIIWFQVWSKTVVLQGFKPSLSFIKVENNKRGTALKTQLIEVRCMSRPNSLTFAYQTPFHNWRFWPCVASPIMEGQTTFLVHITMFWPTIRGHISRSWPLVFSCGCSKGLVQVSYGIEVRIWVKTCTRNFYNMKLILNFQFNYKISHDPSLV